MVPHNPRAGTGPRLGGLNPARCTVGSSNHRNYSISTFTLILIIIVLVALVYYQYTDLPSTNGYFLIIPFILFISFLVQSLSSYSCLLSSAKLLLLLLTFLLFLVFLCLARGPSEFITGRADSWLSLTSLESTEPCP